MTTSQNGGEIAVAISPMKGSKALHHAAHSFGYVLGEYRYKKPQRIYIFAVLF
jgi:hypothetical protein